MSVLKSYFGRVAGEWDDIRAELFGREFTTEALLGLLSRTLTVADFGCGTGNAAAMLAPSGRLWMVANRHLPYEAVLARHFREQAEIGGNGGFKLLSAARPLPTPRPKG